MYASTGIEVITAAFLGVFIAQFIVDITERLNPSFVIERFAGEVPPRFLRENTWGLTRYDVVLQRIEKEMALRDTWQGKGF